MMRQMMQQTTPERMIMREMFRQMTPAQQQQFRQEMGFGDRDGRGRDDDGPGRGPRGYGGPR
jgi:hypothetical protein